MAAHQHHQCYEVVPPEEFFVYKCHSPNQYILLLLPHISFFVFCANELRIPAHCSCCYCCVRIEKTKKNIENLSVECLQLIVSFSRNLVNVECSISIRLGLREKERATTI